MKRSKFKVETFVFSIVMAACMIMPHSISGQSGRTDGFFSAGSEGYENRDGGIDVSGGITNDSFNAPLGGGLLTLVSAGVAYALLKRRKRRSVTGTAALVTLTLLLGLTQCKKKSYDVIPYENKAVNITLSPDAVTRSDVNPDNGTVTFVDGDEILVANNGCYVGRLVFDDGVFTGTITNPQTTDYLHFFHLGNKDCGTLTEGSSQSCSVSISDQIGGLPVISSGCSNEMYSTDITNYTARLYNRCALVRFDVDNYSESAATCISPRRC